MKKYIVTTILWLVALLAQATPALAFDPREVKLRLVLSAYNSPMLGNESALIEAAESRNLDWTLMAAIAGTESSFGKRMPANCLNPYGWGIYGDNKLCFGSFKVAANKVAEGLSTRYNTTSLEAIGKTYNQVSTAGWIAHTRFFMNKIKNTEIPVHELPITL